MPPTMFRTKRLDAAASREAAREDGGDGELVGDQRGSVVDEALALDEGDESAGKAEPLRNRRRRGRVRRRDDRPQDERGRPAEARNRGVCHGGDCDHGRQHEADREQPDGADVRAQLAQRAEEGRAVQQRGEDCDEDDVRRQLDPRHAGDEAERKAAEDERDRIGDSNQLGQRQERGSRCQEADEDEAVGRREVHCAI